MIGGTIGPAAAGGRIRLGFLLIGDGQWRGGLTYQRTLLETISTTMSDTVETILFVTGEQRELANEAFGTTFDAQTVVDERVGGAGAGPRAITALAMGHDRAFEALMREHSVDVVFETARFFGRSFGLPCLSWIPDFQHRHLPELFSRASWWKREIGFQAQTRFTRKRIVMLSSETARADCEGFFPKSRGHTRVVRFAPRVDVAAIRARATQAAAEHALPERYFYLPNHFWAHKNHAVVLDALRTLRRQGTLDNVLPIVMSGPTTDSRDPTLFERTMVNAEAEGLTPWFRHLGLIPFDDVLALNAGAMALLNPSKFEGWASSVEEAKALGTPMILSDIDVHREQQPDASFFGPNDPAELARILLAASRGMSRDREAVEVLQEAGEHRRSAFSAALGGAIHDAYALAQNE
jgi:glycosyltransferase involved in cell wall biosynthesis